MPQLLTPHTTSEQADSLADYLPNGPLFVAKKCLDTNLRNLLEGLAESLRKAEEDINLTTSEYDIPTTTLFIEEWEKFVGIPDDCFIIADTIEQRRSNVLTKLTALGVQTADEFVELAAIFGVPVNVFSGAGEEAEFFTLEFPAIFSVISKEARFTMIVEFLVPESEQFPYIFPFLFGSDLISILECLFNRLRPANVRVEFRQI